MRPSAVRGQVMFTGSMSMQIGTAHGGGARVPSAVQNRFESTIANLATTSENLSASNSRIRDADFAVRDYDHATPVTASLRAIAHFHWSCFVSGSIVYTCVGVTRSRESTGALGASVGRIQVTVARLKRPASFFAVWLFFQHRKHAPVPTPPPPAIVLSR